MPKLTKEDVITEFLNSGMIGVEVVDEKKMKAILGRRPFIIYKGKICYFPRMASENLQDDDNIKIVIRSGHLFMLNRKEADAQT